MQASLTIHILLGICLGIALGSLASSFTVHNLDSLSLSTATPLQVKNIRNIAVRGILREYDDATRILIVDIVSPYSVRDTISIQANVNDMTRISYTPERFESESGPITWYEEHEAEVSALKKGQQMFLMLTNSEQGFYAVVVNLLT